MDFTDFIDLMDYGLNFLCDFCDEFLIGKDAKNKGSQNNSDESTILSKACKMIVDQRFFIKMNNKSQRIEQNQGVIFCRQSSQRINDW